MPENINLLFALQLPPEKAYEYFISKGYRFSWNWFDVWQEIHSHVFTVAKVMKLDILKDIRNEVDKMIKGEDTLRNFYINLEQKLRAKGWWGKVRAKDVPGYNLPAGNGIPPDQEVQLGSPWRLKRILETNQIVSYSAGNYKTLIEAASFAPYWQYIDMDDPPRVRPLHDKIGDYFENKVLIYSHPFWNTWFPPNDWGCRCTVRKWTKVEVEEKGWKIIGQLPQWLLDSKPGEGWAYNPGKEKWNPDLSKYSPEDKELFGFNK